MKCFLKESEIAGVPLRRFKLKFIQIPLIFKIIFCTVEGGICRSPSDVSLRKIGLKDKSECNFIKRNEADGKKNLKYLGFV